MSQHLEDMPVIFDAGTGYWASLLVELHLMVRNAVRTGIRFRTRKGAWKWDINPVEYIQLTQEIACHAPPEVQEMAREIVRGAA